MVQLSEIFIGFSPGLHHFKLLFSYSFVLYSTARKIILEEDYFNICFTLNYSYPEALFVFMLFEVKAIFVYSSDIF